MRIKIPFYIAGERLKSRRILPPNFARGSYKLMAAALLCLSACETPLTDELKNTSTDGLTLYQKNLADDYLELARLSHQKGRPVTAEKMAQRGIQVAQGNVPVLRPPVPPLASPGFVQDYGFAAHLLENPGSPLLYPRRAAKTMSLYDCRYATLDQDPECRKAFHKALDKNFSALVGAIARGDAKTPAPSTEDSAEILKSAAEGEALFRSRIGDTGKANEAPPPAPPIVSENIQEKTEAEPAPHKNTPRVSPPPPPKPAKAAAASPKNATPPEWAYFATGQSDISAEQAADISRYAHKLAQEQGELCRVSLRGYSDGQGDKRANMTLSLKRALAVKKLFVAAGVPEDSVEAVAFGEGWLPQKGETNAAPGKRRAVEIHVTSEN